MKKVFLTAAVLLLAGVGVLLAGGEMVSTPRGDAQSLATADYGGVYVSTLAFGVSGTGVQFATACISSDFNPTQNYCSGVFYGVQWSSGNAGSYDFVDVYDSTSADTALSRLITRIYNVNGSTATAGSNNVSAASGFSGPPKPIRFSRGLIWRPSVSTYNMIGVLYYKQP